MSLKPPKKSDLLSISTKLLIFAPQNLQKKPPIMPSGQISVLNYGICFILDSCSRICTGTNTGRSWQIGWLESERGNTKRIEPICIRYLDRLWMLPSQMQEGLLSLMKGSCRHRLLPVHRCMKWWKN